MTELARWVRHMVGTPGFNFGICAHSFMFEDEGVEDPRLWPWIQGKNMAPKICGYMNVVAYLEIKQEKQVLRFEETDKYFARCQYTGAFDGGKMVNPTMPKIMSKIDAVRGDGTKSKTTKWRGSTRRNRSRYK